MKKRSNYLAGKFLVVLMFTGVLVVSPSAGKIVERIVAVVDGEVITLSDLDQAIRRFGEAGLPGGANPLETKMRTVQVRREALERLVEEKVLEKVAKRYGINVKNEEVAQALETVKRQSGLTESRLQRELESHGFTLESYREFLAAQIRKGKIVDSFIKPKISMDEGKIQEYYQSHQDRFRRPGRVRVSHIFIKVSPEANPQEIATAEGKMERVLQRLGAGVAFDEVAILYGEDAAAASGGDLGFFKKGEMFPAIEEEVFRMEAGEMSGVLKSPQGLHVFKVTEKIEGEVPPYDEIKEGLREQYYRAEVERAYSEWLADIKKRSNIEVKF